MTSFILTILNDYFPGGPSAAGNDSIDGRGGDDTIFAGTGNDTVFGANGNDYLSGEGGDDYLDGSVGNDTLDGGDGYDTLEGGIGADAYINGGPNDTVTYVHATAAVTVNLVTGTHTGVALGDTFSGNFNRFELTGYNDTFVSNGTTGTWTISCLGGNDTATGGTVIDYIYGGDGADSLSGGGANDVLTGDNGNDTLRGGDGHDILTGGAGSDVLDGGLGTDLASYTGATSVVNINLLTASIGGDAAGDTFTSIERFDLGAYNDVFVCDNNPLAIRGYGGNDNITGGTAADYLEGGDGADSLIGGDGADTLRPGLGNDTLIGGSGTDVAWFDHLAFGYHVIQNGGGSFYVMPNGSLNYDLLSGIDVLKFSDGTTYTLGGANNAPATIGETVYIDTNSAGGLGYDANISSLHLVFDPEGDSLTFELVADNTGPNATLMYNTDYGGWMIQYDDFLESTVNFTWRVFDGTSYSSVTTTTIVFYDGGGGMASVEPGGGELLDQGHSNDPWHTMIV